MCERNKLIVLRFFSAEADSTFVSVAVVNDGAYTSVCHAVSIGSMAMRSC